MTYITPKYLRKKNLTLIRDNLFIIIANGNEFVFDLSDKELLEKYFWNNRASRYLYAAVDSDTSIAAHRLLLGIPKGDKRVVDHINGDTRDNRRENLRITDRAGNMMNVINPQGKNPHRGVTWNSLRNKWYVSISYRVSGKRIRVYGGCFSDLSSAIKSREKLEKEYFKSFAPTRR